MQPIDPGEVIHIPLHTILSGLLGGKLSLSLLKKRLGDEDKINKQLKINIKNSPNTTIIIADTNEVQNAAAKLIDGNAFGLAKAQCIPTQSSFTNEREIHKQIIKTMKPYLEHIDYQALRLSYLKIKLEDDHRREDKPNPILKNAIWDIKEDLESKRFRPYGKCIYNDCRSKYFEDIIYPSIVLLESQIENPIERATECKKLIYKNLANNPLNLYVSDDVEDEKIYLQIEQRMLHKKDMIVKVFGRGYAWDRAIAIVTSFIENNPDFKMHKQEDPIGQSEAGCCRIWNPEYGDGWMEIEEKWQNEYGLPLNSCD